MKRTSIIVVILSLTISFIFSHGNPVVRVDPEKADLLTTPVSHTAAGTVFRVDNVKPATNRLPEITGDKQLRHFFGTIEASSQHPASLVKEYTGEALRNKSRTASLRHNPFINALHLAYQKHRSIVLSPDMIWLIISQGFAMHISQYPEKYRHLFVGHRGRKLVRVVNYRVGMGWKNAPWHEVIDQLGGKLKQRVSQKLYTLMVPKFTTSLPVHMRVARLSFMNAMKHYFAYYAAGGCGFPEITLTGSVHDWQDIKRRALKLRRYGLAWWTDNLTPVLDQFIMARQGRINHRFWQHFFKSHRNYGPMSASGWVIRFYPYINYDDGRIVKNSLISHDFSKQPKKTERRLGFVKHSISLKNFPNNLSKVPFLFQDVRFRKVFKMEFVGGFIGFTQDKSGQNITPRIGWVVRRATDGARRYREDLRIMKQQMEQQTRQWKEEERRRRIKMKSKV